MENLLSIDYKSNFKEKQHKEEVVQTFLDKFNFDPKKSLYVGIERESFTSREGKIIPLVPEILPLIKLTQPKFQDFGYELSACQLEMRYGPYHISDVLNGFSLADRELKNLEEKFNFSCYFADTAGQEISLDVYPDPTGRYAKMASSLDPKVLHAACYVAGTHVHVGMPNAEDALRVYNKLSKHLQGLIEVGDNSQGERISYYKLMSNKTNPQLHENIMAWVNHSLDEKYYEDPRKNWALIRISIHGTIEFRMFGSTPDTLKIYNWVNMCYDLCKMYL